LLGAVGGGVGLGGGGGGWGLGEKERTRGGKRRKRASADERPTDRNERMLGAREALPLPLMGVLGAVLSASLLIHGHEKSRTALGLEWGRRLDSNSLNAARG